MITFEFGRARLAALSLTALVLAGCAAKPPPPPPPAPPPPVEVIPFRPLPPSGATYIMTIPPRGADGQRLTQLRGLSDDERLWYFRSAWNVAALNCIGPQYDVILDGYRAFLKDNVKALKTANSRVEQTYLKRFPTRAAAVADRERVMTSVYNYFALPPARVDFCQAAARISALALATPKPSAGELAAAHFAEFETPFETFFTAYEQYQRESAAWDARYGAQYGASQPGYVAVQAARASAAVPQVGVSNPASTSLQPVTQAGVVTDAETGAQIPVVPLPAQGPAVPVVQPVPQPTARP